MPKNLYFVTGTTGAGKSTTLTNLLQDNQASPYVFFDIDWLADTASGLAKSSIYEDPTTWPPYNALWFEILHSVYKNNKIPVLFCPLDPSDVTEENKPAWCDDIKWLLLDCGDDLIRERLGPDGRNWSDEKITEALEDADELRSAITTHIDSGSLTPDEVSAQVISWITSVTQE